TSTIVPLLVCALTLDRRCAGVPQAWSLRCVLSGRRRQSVLPDGTPVNLVRGLAAPGKPRPSCVLTVVPSPYRAAAHFHPRWWSMDHDYLVLHSSKVDVAALSPYITRTIKQFGDYAVNLEHTPAPLDGTMD